LAIKLVAIDIDGTLVNSKLELTDEVVQAIKEAEDSGVKIVLCTGRPTPGAQSYIKELGLNQEEDYSITYNGALVKKTDTEEVILQTAMDHNDFLKLYEASKQAGVHFHMLHNDTIITLDKDIHHYTVHESYVSGVPLFYSDFEEISAGNLYSKMMMVDWPEDLDQGIKKLPEELWEDYTVVRSEGYYLEFLNKNSSKGKALKELAGRLNISSEEVMAIGDSGNDIDMIEYASLGVAMENATDELKSKAQYITQSSDDNGVAGAINKFVLNK